MDGKRLKQIRKKMGDTQVTLAQKLGVKTTTVSKWEQGLSNPNLQIFESICRMYDVSGDYLLGLSPVNRSISHPFTEDKQEMLNDFVSLLERVS